MKFGIKYKVEDHGWALVYLTDGDKKIDSPVSYLHDSLSELAEMAIHLKDGHNESKVVFMDEPGELQLVVKVEGETAFYEARWFNDWASWNMHPESDYRVELKGETTPARIVQQITTALWEVYENIGPEKYKELWCEHKFPMEMYRKLSGA